jgi:hypothetical protein
MIYRIHKNSYCQVGVICGRVSLSFYTYVICGGVYNLFLTWALCGKLDKLSALLCDILSRLISVESKFLSMP